MKIINDLLVDADTIVFLDFEGTQTTSEIIAVGAIKVTLDNKKNIKKKFKNFKYYINTSTLLGKFEYEFSGINNELLKEKGIDFKDFLSKFEKYVGNKESIRFLTYGNYDMRMLHETMIKNNIEMTPFLKKIFKNHIDFSLFIKKYMKKEGNATLSLIEALKILNITPAIPQHDPLTDSINLLYLYENFLKNKKIIKEEYKKIILNYQKIPNPIRKILKKLQNDSTCYMKDVMEFIDEEF